MKDWSQPIDNGPTIHEPKPKHHRRKGRKRFVIERRYIGPVRKGFKWLEEQREWSSFRKYEREADMVKAIESLKHKETAVTYRTTQFWEYRRAP